MKKSLTILGSVAVLLVASTDMNNSTNNTLTTKSIKPMINETATALFNNKYGYLSTGKTANWITSQSQKDGNFYSYDTSHLTNADGSIWYLSDGKTDARNAFKVDSDGQLVANIKISDQDKINLENSKEEMIKDREITTIKDKYNPYSKSEYSTSYFDGAHPNWQYLQFGGANKHIDISNQAGANKVEYSNSLSETSGLYYIAKAVIDNKISQSIATDLGEYFINQSSVKILNKDLILQIIKTMIIHKNIFSFIKSLPFTNDNKNYSLNYIFDSNNNLIAIYFNKWDKNNIVIDFTNEFLIDKSFNGTQLSTIINYPGYNPLWGRNFDYVNYEYTNVICWKKFANNWNEFIKNYPTLNFGSDDFINVWASGYGNDIKRGSQLNFVTNQISEQKYKSYFGEVKFIYNFTVPMNPFFARVYADSWFWIYHDQENIYLNYAAALASDVAQEGTHLSIKVNKVIFNGS